jgi:hypothetical protein
VLLALGGAALAADDHSDWAVAVVAGDWHAHDGSPTEIFDNARRDVAASLSGIGFRPVNLAQFSVRAWRYPAAHPANADARTIAATLAALSNRARSGCLVYFSSHGGSSGIVLSQSVLSPAQLDGMLSSTCSARPTIVVISACYSGVFVNRLARPNRMIITAARADRSSFGCSGTEKYPYFDACFLSSIDETGDFRALAIRTKRCVARMERLTQMWPPSEPQIFIGNRIASQLPAW